jgi:hypothetical protein
VNRNFKLYSAINGHKLRLYAWQPYIVWSYIVLTKGTDVLSSVIRNTLFSLSCFHSSSWIIMHLCYNCGLATWPGQTKLKIRNTICWNSCSHCSKTLLQCRIYLYFPLMLIDSFFGWGGGWWWWWWISTFTMLGNTQFQIFRHPVHFIVLIKKAAEWSKYSSRADARISE